jgi:hypothetical protein
MGLNPLASIVHNNRSAFLAGCAILGVGLGLGGFAIGDGLVRMKRADREVTVRGVAQREVTADRASWQAHYSEHAHDLGAALAAVNRDSGMIEAYLRSQGFAGANAAPGSADVSVEDETIKDKPTGNKVYTVKRTIAFTTGNVAGVEQIEANKDRLAQQGMVLDDVRASYEYTRLDQIKPDMIADATKDARRAAEKFANDSGSSVGGIKSATQGYFAVSSRDTASSGDDNSESDGNNSSRTASSPNQRVRVVTTIDYYLS